MGYCDREECQVELDAALALVQTLEEALTKARAESAEIAFREVWVRSGGVAARSVRDAILRGRTTVRDEIMAGAER